MSQLPNSPASACAGTPTTAISTSELNAIRQLIFDEAGISLSDAKRSLVCSRLSRRLRELHLATYSEYIQHLEEKDPQGTERQTMINCLTTNKTDFFREPHHFDFLCKVVFPAARRRAAEGGPRELKIWSAACSMGDEPYSIAMTILKHFGQRSGWNIQVLASDINTEVLKTARDGVYSMDKIQDVPESIKQKFFLRGTGKQYGLCQVTPEVKKLVSFKHINLLQYPLPVQAKFDAIFCRNVIIYFDSQTQRRVLPAFAERLKTDGFLMLGHSENVPWLSNVFKLLGSTIHQLLGCPTPATSDVQHSMQVKNSTNRRPPEVIERHSLVSGETFASGAPITVSTVLGSCVSACLFDPVTCVGGINHFMLPNQPGDRQRSARYGIHAMELLINEIMHLGGDRRRLQAKVFGGAKIMQSEHESHGIGSANISFVREFLNVERIPIVAEQLGKDRAMRLDFITNSGRAFVKTLSPSHRIVESEQRDHERSVVSFQTDESTSSPTLF